MPYRENVATSKRDSSAPQARLQVNVKLTGRANPERGHAMLSDMHGVRRVTQTFPDENDEELKRLFVVEVDRADGESALQELRRHPDVEYAEAAPSRKLIR